LTDLLFEAKPSMLAAEDFLGVLVKLVDLPNSRKLQLNCKEIQFYSSKQILNILEKPKTFAKKT
jgi:hypothetical protein